MKALSIWPDYAAYIAMGLKTVEFRSWKTDYRGDIVICSNSRTVKGYVSSHAICIVELVDIEPFTNAHIEAAMMDFSEPGYAWILKNPRMIKPVPVKGQLRLWNYDGPIEIIPDEEWCVTVNESDELADERWESFVKKYWEPLMGNKRNRLEDKEIEKTKADVIQEKNEPQQEKKEGKTMAEFKYEIVKHIGVLSESAKGWTKELNLISWNGGNPKYDIRDWAPEHEKMGKGVTLTEEEASKLKSLL